MMEEALKSGRTYGIPVSPMPKPYPTKAQIIKNSTSKTGSGKVWKGSSMRSMQSTGYGGFDSEQDHISAMTNQPNFDPLQKKFRTTFKSFRSTGKIAGRFGTLGHKRRGSMTRTGHKRTRSK